MRIYERGFANRAFWGGYIPISVPVKAIPWHNFLVYLLVLAFSFVWYSLDRHEHYPLLADICKSSIADVILTSLCSRARCVGTNDEATMAELKY